MESFPKPYEYVLFIDEAGDDGLKRVRPIDDTGGTEWLVIGGVLVRAENEHIVPEWVRELRQAVRAHQGPALHFRKLSLERKMTVCSLLASKKAVLFVVCSNKKNMRGYHNERAAKMGGKQWFYNFCVRFLMERVTDLCLMDSIKKYGAPRYLKVQFSQRGGHQYGQTKAYWEHLKRQSTAGTTLLNKWQIRSEVLRFNLVDYVPHTNLAGLQLADVVASAFYQAVDTIDVEHNIEPAYCLRHQMARRAGVIADYGVVLQPTPPSKAQLSVSQQEIFKKYGYRF